MTAPKLFRDQAGFALFMVLWVLTLLTIIVGQFCFSMRSEANLTRNFKEAAEAFYIAEAGASRAVWELLPQSSPSASERLDTEGADTVETIWRVNLPIPSVDFGAGAYTVRIDNESGRINLNTAGRDLLRLAVANLAIDEARKDTIIDAILDWRDLDELHRLNGAESDYYRALPEPYDSKNGPFDTLEELLLVRGVSPDIFYNGLDQLLAVAPSSAAAPRAAGQRRQRRRAGGAGGININAASPAMLGALPEMTEALAQAIIDYRSASGDFKTLNEVEDIVGSSVFAALAPYVSLAMSPVYTICSEGRVTGSRVRQTITLQVIIDPAHEKKYRIVRRLLNDDPVVTSSWQ